jgi:hypothetical protein
MTAPEVAAALKEYWSMPDGVIEGCTDDDVFMLLGIHVGLTMLFGNSKEGELRWLTQPHPKLSGASPFDHIFEHGQSGILDVADLVAIARGLR